MQIVSANPRESDLEVGHIFSFREAEAMLQTYTLYFCPYYVTDIVDRIVFLCSVSISAFGKICSYSISE